MPKNSYRKGENKMPKIVQLILAGVIFFAVVTLITWISSLTNNREDVMASRAGQCTKLERNIMKQISAANYCRRDEECRAVKIRCPWGNDSSCRYILINRNHSLSLMQNDTIQFRLCISRDEEIKKKYSFCLEESPVGYNCPDLEKKKLKCVDNKCVE